jgi:hypothetical protein
MPTKSDPARRTEAFTRFTRAMRQILSVPKDELLRREAEYKKQADANPNKRGPKRKRRS